ncbi:hypothetical protein D9611_006058 [Ephemerocybe angulata]|uniref:Fungal-type protein kinase domain-containing protein n=1 Tax=Ephemerocybe angulata TaxID=980116 RepID=A0A8H5CFU9_9AGAR|nr:hypothetical protein D9611_006058 [Tulosesus angulatus]
MPASSKEPTLTRSQTRAQPAQQTRRAAMQNSRTKAKAQPNVGTRSAAASRQRPLTRSVTAANRAQQDAPPTEPKPASSTPVAPVSSKPESSSTSTTSDTSSSSSGEYSSYDETEDELYPQRKAAISDLHELPTVDGACLKELYTDVASDRIINAFLTKSSLYDSEKRVWVDIPQETYPGTDLKTAVIKIVRSIIQDLGHSKGIRDVIDTRNTKLPHIGDPTQSSKPDMAIKALGPSFSVPCASTIGFSNIASVFDVKCDADVRERHADQLAVYNRQIFFHQLNRLFARSLLITETRVRLVHCDRSGGYKTDWLNIHEDPVTLIRLILGLSSPREAVLGLDTSIQWTIKNGRKVAGTITTLDFHRKRVKYQLVMGRPYFVAPSVRGVGTVCWVAKDKAGKHIVIKDSWRVDIQVPEYTFLEKARGNSGVAWMFAYEDGRVQTKALRPGNFDFDAPDFYNRTMCRVSMECYGAPLHEFTSQRQAIAALRDAIQGHWNLLRAGILHRDVSIDNILFGKDGAEEGHRGILIDLEMAASTGGGPTSRVITENRFGTYLYHSIAVLRSGRDERLLLPAAHDYLDDLESFFWILCHLLHGYEGVRRPVPDAFDPESLLGRFENPQVASATAIKQEYLATEGPSFAPPSLFWSDACVELCEAFRVYMAPIVKAKGSSRFRKNAAIGHTILQDLYNNINHHYTDIISFFDTALEKLVRPGGEAPRREESTSLPPTPAAPGGRVGRTSGSSPSTPVTANLKRPREDVLNAPVKRRRLADA